MDDPGGPYSLVLALAFLFLSAFFSGSETALFATPRHALRNFRNSRAGVLTSRLIEHPERTLSTILIGNTMVNVLFTGFLTALILATAVSRETGELLSTLASFVVLLVFGEVLPKVVATNRPLSFLSLTALPLYAWSRLLAPLSWALGQIYRLVDRMLPGEGEAIHIRSEDIIGAALTESSASGHMAQSTSDAIHNIFDTDSTPVQRVMTPKKLMTAIEIGAPLALAAERILTTGYSRLPVYEEDEDRLVGLIYMKDLLTASPDQTSLRNLLRPLVKVGPQESVEKTLRLLQTNRAHMGAVYSTGGRLLGIITLEDLVEEIVGEIIDEHDRPKAPGGDF